MNDSAVTFAVLATPSRGPSAKGSSISSSWSSRPSASPSSPLAPTSSHLALPWSPRASQWSSWSCAMLHHARALCGLCRTISSSFSSTSDSRSSSWAPSSSAWWLLKGDRRDEAAGKPAEEPRAGSDCEEPNAFSGGSVSLEREPLKAASCCGVEERLDDVAASRSAEAEVEPSCGAPWGGMGPPSLRCGFCCPGGAIFFSDCTAFLCRTKSFS
mmetsp:Transcript_86307/g.222274  ORF Transcript_86307/g.222274 Transcript_86307/m.222274 type:complete len:214 (-) Transcript_86307:500-1141(-)